ncbi:MAG: hypothetical protein ACI9PP_001319 [Halobacteriales archaeon]|jgi:hypothetical protein
MDEAEREELLETISSRSATVGHQLPECVTVQGTEMNLKEFVFETESLDRLPPGERERIESVRQQIHEERQACKQRLETDESLTGAEGEELARKIIGLDRALNALRNLHRQGEFAEEARRQKIADADRWISFVDRLTGG